MIEEMRSQRNKMLNASVAGIRPPGVGRAWPPLRFRGRG